MELRSNLDVLVSGFESLETAFPSVAGQLELSDDEPQELLLGTTLPQIEPALARIELDVRFREERVADGRSVRRVPLQALPWLVVAIGAALIAVATSALVATRRPSSGGTPAAGPDAGS